MNGGRAVLVLLIGAPVPDWFDETQRGCRCSDAGSCAAGLCSDKAVALNSSSPAWHPRLHDAAYVFEDAGDRFIQLADAGGCDAPPVATTRLSRSRDCRSGRP